MIKFFRMYFVLLAAVTMMMLVHYRDGLSTDPVKLFVAAQQWSEGKGFQAPAVNKADVSASGIQPYYASPPGYALCLGVLLRLGMSVIPAYMILEVLCGLILVFSWHQILLRRKVSLSAMLILWAIWTFATSLAPWGENNLVALTLFSLSLWTALIFLESTGQKRTFSLVLSAIFLGLSGWIRYLYIPLLPILPLGILAVGFVRRQRTWPAALLHLCVSAAVVGPLVLGLLYGNVPAAEKYPLRDSMALLDPLRHIVPWGVQTFRLNWTMAALPLQSLIVKGWWIHGSVLVVLNWVIIAAYLGSVFLVVTGRFRASDPDKKGFFITTVGALILVNVLATLLVIDALVKPHQIAWWGNNRLWYFIGEPRYLQIVYPFIAMEIVAMLDATLRARFLRRMAATAAIGVCVLNVFKLVSMRDNYRSLHSPLIAKTNVFSIPPKEDNLTPIFLSVTNRSPLVNEALMSGYPLLRLLPEYFPIRTSKPLRILMDCPKQGPVPAAARYFLERFPSRTIGEFRDLAILEIHLPAGTYAWPT